MKVYLQIPDSIFRYLQWQGISMQVIQELAITVAENTKIDEEFIPFLKYYGMDSIMSHTQVWELQDQDFKILFTKSFQEGYYVGELLENCTIEAFFRYILI